MGTELSERDKVHDRQGWVQRVVQWLLPASTKMFPQAGISLVVYEMVKRRLDQSNYVDVEVDEDIFD